VIRAAIAEPRVRLALGVVLVVGLAAAWFVVGHGAAGAPGRASTLPSVTHPATTSSLSERRSPATPAAVDSVVAVPRWVPAGVAATCRTHGTSKSNTVVDCTPGRGVESLLYRAFASVAALRAAYASEGMRGGGAGPSACAQGAPEERSWSTAPEPTRAAGRYRCSLVERNARLVWTNEAAKILGVASRADSDLRSLYQWWTTVPGPTATGPTAPR
jgi:hypothetical protein